MKNKVLILTILCCFTGISTFAQNSGNIVPIPYGDFEKWFSRTVKDSRIIGSKVHTLYEIGEAQTIPQNSPYVKDARVPWRSSNVFADVGVVKGSSTVSRDTRETGGYVAKLETKLEKVRVLGLFNINVIAAGSVYLGNIIEPIKSVKSAIENVCRGVEISSMPKQIMFDYKYLSTGERYYANGMGDPTALGEQNFAEVLVFVQKRWEDEEGNIFAKRLGTANIRLDDTDGKWVNNYTLDILKGDISKLPIFKKHLALLTKKTEKDFRHYDTNSKGEQKRIVEIGWGGEEDQPTHIFLIFSSSQNGAYVGAPGSTLWVDNVKYVY